MSLSQICQYFYLKIIIFRPFATIFVGIMQIEQVNTAYLFPKVSGK